MTTEDETIEKLERALLRIEKKLKKEKIKKEQEKYAMLYQQGLFLKYIMIEVKSNIESLDAEFIKFENNNVDVFCKKIDHYLPQ